MGLNLIGGCGFGRGVVVGVVSGSTVSLRRQMHLAGSDGWSTQSGGKQLARSSVRRGHLKVQKYI